MLAVMRKNHMPQKQRFIFVTEPKLLGSLHKPSVANGNMTGQFAFQRIFIRYKTAEFSDFAHIVNEHTGD